MRASVCLGVRGLFLVALKRHRVLGRFRVSKRTVVGSFLGIWT